MSLADDLAEAPTPARKGPRCTVAVLLESLEDRDREALIAAFANPAWETKAIYKRLRPWNIGEETVKRHRRAECRCPSPTN